MRSSTRLTLLAIWSSIDAPVRWSDRLSAFWFDVTKADWRESMVLGVQAPDTGKQTRHVGLGRTTAVRPCGVSILAVAPEPFALVDLARHGRRSSGSHTQSIRCFAVTYNVGDSHVFFLPGHFFAAFAAAPP